MPLGFPISITGVGGIVVLVAFAILWVVQFAALMSLDPDTFRGPYDRLGWIAAFVVAWFLAPIAFLVWRQQNPRRRSAGT